VNAKRSGSFKMNHFWDGFEKRAGVAGAVTGYLTARSPLAQEKQSAARSEILGTIPWGPLSGLGALAGIAVGPYSDKDRKKVNKKSISNLIPGVGGYRSGRRLSGTGLDANERPND